MPHRPQSRRGSPARPGRCRRDHRRWAAAAPTSGPRSFRLGCPGRRPAEGTAAGEARFSR